MLMHIYLLKNNNNYWSQLIQADESCCALFTKCISRINGRRIDKAQSIDIVMAMYSLIEYRIIIQKHLEVYGTITKI